MDDQPRWEKLEQLFHQALELDNGERAEFLRTACGGDLDLRSRVESLLSHDESGIDISVSPTLSSGPRIGVYQIVAKLGSGGMGEVYLATDTRLNRKVALKVLPARFAADRERRERFLREARAASALNHSNIVTVYDVGRTGKLNYIVMEYIKGKSLRELIPHDGLKLNESVRYATHIAQALCCAHAIGMAHRDLKPANVLITAEGTAKVLDFGLAKQFQTVTEQSTLTEEGLIVGTVAYMSPEQAEGRPVDARSDIFSFGCLLFEMVTGRRAFQRNSAASTLAAVVHEEPPVANSIAKDVPSALAKLIERCLRKMPEDRFQRMEDVKVALDGIREPESRTPHRGAETLRTRGRGLFWVFGIAVTAIVVGMIAFLQNNTRQGAILSAIPLTTYPGLESGASFSPDGQQVAFTWCQHEGAPAWVNEYLNVCNIYIKQIGVEPPSRLTEANAKDFNPSWSPDGKWIAFLRLTSVTKLAVLIVPQRGGHERVLQEYNLKEDSDMPPGSYLAWTPDSRWLVCPTPDRKGWYLSLLAVDTSLRRRLTKPLEGPLYDSEDTSPAVSPDGSLLVFSRLENGYDLYKLRLSEQYLPQGSPVNLRSEHFINLGVAWLSDGSGLVSASDWRGKEGLWLTSMSSSTKPHRLPYAARFAAEPAVSLRGRRLAYTAYREDTNIWRIELTQPGHKPAAPSPIISSTQTDDEPTFSPDGRRIAFISERSGNREVWLCSNDGSNPQQLTFLEGTNIHGPQWSPDGKEIALTILNKKREGALGIVNATTGTMRVLSIAGGAKWPSWSPDGQWLYFANGVGKASSIWRIRPDNGSPIQLTRGTVDDMPQASADGGFVYFSKGWPGPFSVWKIPVGGGEATKLIDGVSVSGQWTTGPKGIYFFGTPDFRGRSELCLYETATGRTTKIMLLERGVSFRIAVSPDGLTILYPQFDDRGSDLMLVNNFP